jgi:hypothetical protein
VFIEALSVARISATCVIQQQLVPQQEASASGSPTQHQDQLEGVTVKVGGHFFSPRCFPVYKGRWLNHLELHKPHRIRW